MKKRSIELKLDEVVTELNTAVEIANNKKGELEKALEKEKEKRKSIINTMSNTTKVIDINELDSLAQGDIYFINKKIYLLEKALKEFDYVNYEEYRIAALKYIEFISDNIFELDNKIKNEVDEAERKLIQAQENRDNVKEIIIPQIREEIEILVQPLQKSVYGTYRDYSGASVLTKVKRQIEKYN